MKKRHILFIISLFVFCFGMQITYSNNNEEAAPTEAAPTEAVPTEAAPTEAAPTEAAPTEAAPTEAAPTEAAPTEAALTEAVPTEAAPTEAAPTEAAPTEAVPTEAAPTEAAPTEAAPTEAAPTEAAPTEAVPTEVTPANITPMGAIDAISILETPGNFFLVDDHYEGKKLPDMEKAIQDNDENAKEFIQKYIDGSLTPEDVRGMFFTIQKYFYYPVILNGEKNIESIKIKFDQEGKVVDMPYSSKIDGGKTHIKLRLPNFGREIFYFKKTEIIISTEDGKEIKFLFKPYFPETKNGEFIGIKDYWGGIRDVFFYVGSTDSDGNIENITTGTEEEGVFHSGTSKFGVHFLINSFKKYDITLIYIDGRTKESCNTIDNGYKFYERWGKNYQIFHDNLDMQKFDGEKFIPYDGINIVNEKEFSFTETGIYKFSTTYIDSRFKPLCEKYFNIGNGNTKELDYVVMSYNADIQYNNGVGRLYVFPHFNQDWSHSLYTNEVINYTVKFLDSLGNILFAGNQNTCRTGEQNCFDYPGAIIKEEVYKDISGMKIEKKTDISKREKGDVFIVHNQYLKPEARDDWYTFYLENESKIIIKDTDNAIIPIESGNNIEKENFDIAKVYLKESIFGSELYIHKDKYNEVTSITKKIDIKPYYMQFYFLHGINIEPTEYNNISDINNWLVFPALGDITLQDKSGTNFEYETLSEKKIKDVDTSTLEKIKVYRLQNDGNLIIHKDMLAVIGKIIQNLSDNVTGRKMIIHYNLLEYEEYSFDAKRHTSSKKIFSSTDSFSKNTSIFQEEISMNEYLFRRDISISTYKLGEKSFNDHGYPIEGDPIIYTIDLKLGESKGVTHVDMSKLYICSSSCISYDKFKKINQIFSLSSFRGGYFRIYALPGFVNEDFEYFDIDYTINGKKMFPGGMGEDGGGGPRA